MYIEHLIFLYVFLGDGGDAEQDKQDQMIN